MKKRSYFQPQTACVYLQAEQALLNYSAQTSNPINGGDPTGGYGNGTTTSPFGAPAAAPENSFDWNN